jgi:type IV pilus assembly protein PilV
MTASTTSRQQQTGAYLLEALIGILIFALGVLGIVGLQAASLRTTWDSAMRAEAVFAANQLLGQMLADDEANLVAN